MTLYTNISKKELNILIDNADRELNIKKKERLDSVLSLSKSENFQSFLSNFNKNSNFENFIKTNKNTNISLISDTLIYLEPLEKMYILSFYGQESFVMINNILVHIDKYSFKIIDDNSVYYDYFEKMNELYAFHSELSDLIKNPIKSKQFFSEIEIIYLQKDLADMTSLLYKSDKSQSREFICNLDNIDNPYYKDSSINFHKRLSYFMKRLQ